MSVEVRELEGRIGENISNFRNDVDMTAVFCYYSLNIGQPERRLTE